MSPMNHEAVVGRLTRIAFDDAEKAIKAATDAATMTGTALAVRREHDGRYYVVRGPHADYASGRVMFDLLGDGTILFDARRVQTEG